MRRVTRLKEKIANKNPNEFDFHMINSGLINGRHYEKRKDSENVEEVVSKNLKYLNWKRGVELKKIEKLQSELHFINYSDEPVNKRIIFKEQGPKKKLKAIEVTNQPSSSSKKSNSLEELTKSAKQINVRLNKKILDKIAKEKTKSYKNLMTRLDREKRLRDLIVSGDFTLKKSSTKSKLNPKRFADEDDDDEQLDKQLIKKLRK